MSDSKVTFRLEAFSDAMLAIIITIMVLELKPPRDTTWESIHESLTGLIAYVMSFMIVGVYWGNHHHLVHTVKKLSSGIMLANLGLLFWLSLVPFATGWMSETNFKPMTVAVYAVLLNICGLFYMLLQKQIEKNHRDDASLKNVLRRQGQKGIISVILYAAAIPVAYANSYLAVIIIICVAIMWLVPDKKVFENRG